MQSDLPLASSAEYEAVKVKGQDTTPTTEVVATEVPFTILVNETELATLMCTPENLKELCYGFLFSNGIIKKQSDVLFYECDEAKWVGRTEVAETPDLSLFEKRLYTTGCGKGVMYSSVAEAALRHPLKTSLQVERETIIELMLWLQKSSELFKKSGGVHTAALSENGRIPRIAIDDIGRHNTVDKVIGHGLLRGVDFSHCVLACSGRTSSDMLYKAKRCGIPVSVSRGAPTHQTILLARETGVTIIGFARGDRFTVYTHPERIAGLR